MSKCSIILRPSEEIRSPDPSQARLTKVPSTQIWLLHHWVPFMVSCKSSKNQNDFKKPSVKILRVWARNQSRNFLENFMDFHIKISENLFLPSFIRFSRNFVIFSSPITFSYNNFLGFWYSACFHCYAIEIPYMHLCNAITCMYVRM